jgi:hypothetical protein
MEARMSESLALFTAKWLCDFFDENGSGWWVLDPSRAMKAKQLLIVRNTYPKHYHPTYGVGPGPHNHIVMVAKGLKITGEVVDENSHETRYCVGFSHYALLPTPILKTWGNSQNPVRYVQTDKVPDLGTPEWKPFTDLTTEEYYVRTKRETEEPQTEKPDSKEMGKFSTLELVQMLAKQLNQSPDTILRKLLAT